MAEKDEYDKDLSRYYGDDLVTAIITLKVDTKDADTIASKISKFEDVRDCFLVTGDTDIVAKAVFKNYSDLKEFVLRSLAPIQGIKETKTLLVVTIYKNG